MTKNHQLQSRAARLREIAVMGRITTYCRALEASNHNREVILVVFLRFVVGGVDGG
jgi:hypothetical protein